MKILVLLANGFEEAEAFCPMDVFKRAGIEVVTASVGEKEVVSSHGFKVFSDIRASEATDSYDAVFCPGGMPGAVNLRESKDVERALLNAFNSKKIVSAICASPAVVLSPLGILKSRNFTCYPGFEERVGEGNFTDEGVVKDGNVITGKSAGWAFDLGLKIIETLLGVEKAREVRSQIHYKEE